MADHMADWAAAMRAGDHAAAWAISDRELQRRDPARRDDPTLPYHQRWVWDGRPYEGRHCLVRCYHGLGDSIQFARFLPMLAARTASLTVEMQPRLIDLIAGPGGGIRFVPFIDAHPLPQSECDLEITELDFALRLTPADAAMPYLAAESGVLPHGCVGLCHGAGPWDPARSIPPHLLAPICAMAPCISLMPEATTLPVLNPDGCPFDMKATAALIAATDLVITVDTMIAHLAGAMGKPTWLLLKSDPDWRWPVGARGTPWYPSMRIYAQPSAGDWETPLAELARDLAACPALAAER
ncbi:hypothetical protein EWH10_01015 [Sphingobium fuliginis]|nr:hypothetical protein TZ53_21635 [Sphingobium sp. YBL2]RYM00681.1 hypothetical protein EWH10_01015 [Sphingobium fuliginis]